MVPPARRYQRRLCERFVAPVIAAICCQDSTIYPARTPGGYPLADEIAARIRQAHAEQDTGAKSPRADVPLPRGSYWRSSNFDRRVLAPAYQAAGWRDPGGNRTWTWHSLRHVFCTTALSCWHLEPTDVSCMTGH